MCQLQVRLIFFHQIALEARRIVGAVVALVDELSRMLVRLEDVFPQVLLLDDCLNLFRNPEA
jgi:hypothetical protein